MELEQPDIADDGACGEVDVTRHLRDHLECAARLASMQDLTVVGHLVRMALLALSGGAPPGDAR